MLIFLWGGVHFKLETDQKHYWGGGCFSIFTGEMWVPPSEINDWQNLGTPPRIGKIYVPPSMVAIKALQNGGTVYFFIYFWGVGHKRQKYWMSHILSVSYLNITEMPGLHKSDSWQEPNHSVIPLLQVLVLLIFR